jgi:hypothetical protein
MYTFQSSFWPAAVLPRCAHNAFQYPTQIPPPSSLFPRKYQFLEVLRCQRRWSSFIVGKSITQASRGFEGNSCFFIFVKLLQDNGFMKCCPCEFGFVDFWSLSLSLGCLVHKVTLCRSIIIRIKLCLGTYIASSCRPSRA